MQHQQQFAGMSGPGAMFLSATIFGYFGFMMIFYEVDAETGNLIPLVVTLKWTLRVSAIAFLICAIVSVAVPFAGSLLYAVVGLCAAFLFAIVGVWDLNSAYDTGIHPFLLFVFAAWNGFSSYSSLRELLLVRAIQADNVNEPTRVE